MRYRITSHHAPIVSILLFLLPPLLIAAEQCVEVVNITMSSGAFDTRNFTFDASCQRYSVRLSNRGKSIGSSTFLQFSNVVIPALTADCSFGIHVENENGMARSICSSYTVYSLSLLGSFIDIRFAPSTHFSLTYDSTSNASQLAKTSTSVPSNNITGVICFHPVTTQGSSDVNTFLVRLTLLSAPDSISVSTVGTFRNSAGGLSASSGAPVCLSSIVRAQLNFTQPKIPVDTSGTIPMWGIATLGVIGATIAIGILLISIDIHLRKKSGKVNPAVVHLQNGNSHGQSVSST